jgi:hypothetical protein
VTTDPGSGLPVSGLPSSAAGSHSDDAEASDRLQALLAQASQGQQDEQREISGALGEMRGQLQRLSQEIAELRAAPAGEAVDGGAINNVTVEIREAVRFLSERLDGVTRMVAQRGEELADVRTALTAIDAHVRSQAETMGVLSTGLQALPSYGERVSGLSEQLEAIAQRLGGIEAAASRPTADSGVNNRLAAIEASITPLSQQVSSSGQVAAEHGAALADATASLRALHNKVESISQGTQAALASAPTFDDSALTSLDQRLASVATDLKALSQEVATLAGAGATDTVSGDDLDRAMRESEERLRGHVDDAVMALAQALLRPRAAAAPTHLAPPDVEPSVFATSPGSGGGIPVAAAAPAGAPAQPEAEPEQQWWERDEVVAPAPSALAPSAPAVSTPAIPALDEDLHTPEAGAIDFSQAEMADEDDVDDDDDDDADNDEADDDAVAAHFDMPPVQADDGVTAPPPVVPSLPPLEPSATPAAPPAVPSLPDTGSSWSPEVPAGRPEGNEVDPGTVVPERKRRFFGRDKG